MMIVPLAFVAALATLMAQAPVRSGDQTSPPPASAPSSPVTPPQAATPAGPTDAPQGVLAFIAAYPDYLEKVDGGDLIWRDGTRMPLADLGLDPQGRPLRVRDAPANDPLVAATEWISAIDYEPIYMRMYGDCRAGGVDGRLTGVEWNRAGPGGAVAVRMSAANGVAAALQKVSDELDALGAAVVPFVRPLGGTYNCRNIALTNRLSLHGYGIAVDINPAHGDYWLTAGSDGEGRKVRRNLIPMEIVAAFERQGFVWGGRWNRFDTFHFEYRPEYRLATGGTLPELLTRETFAAYFGGRVKTTDSQFRFAGSGVVRMSYAPRAANAAPCHRWVRQPGPNFGKCLSAPKPLAPARADNGRRERGAPRGGRG